MTKRAGNALVAELLKQARKKVECECGQSFDSRMQLSRHRSKKLSE
jgi:hypothetical protein